MLFDWDTPKDAANIRKHGISLSRAREMFDSPTIRFPDKGRDYGELRFICYGLIDQRVYCCVHTDRGKARRIISLRKANKGESHDYFTAI
ncbi:MAG: BrnT family toxin [Alphaproteobacteria bacterium]|nr:BrnT family toxin [Alphaproteobacteria bacterium]